MSTIGTNPMEAHKQGLQILYSGGVCTLVVQTQKQRVIVVQRKSYVLFIRESDGEVKRGTKVEGFGPFGYNYLVLYDGDEAVARTTVIRSVYVLEN